MSHRPRSAGTRHEMAGQPSAVSLRQPEELASGSEALAMLALWLADVAAEASVAELRLPDPAHVEEQAG